MKNIIDKIKDLWYDYSFVPLEIIIYAILIVAASLIGYGAYYLFDSYVAGLVVTSLSSLIIAAELEKYL